MSTASRFTGAGAVLGLAAGLLVGAGLSGAGPLPSSRALAATPSATPIADAGATSAGVPGAPAAVTVGGAGVAQSGTAIAYPYFGGSPGVAPDHTIVVTGVGQADLAADTSNRASAQKSALSAALADAKAQADAIASATGLSITGVLSVSASVTPDYGVQPLAATGSGMPACLPGAPESGSKAGGETIVPQPVCPPYRQVVSASVTVAYEVE